MPEGTIYLLKMRDTAGRYIYKVGKSINFDKRFNNYNYADILSLVWTDNIDDDEKAVIHIFRKHCKLDKGNEFFTSIKKHDTDSGNCDSGMQKIFINYFHNKDPTANKITYTTTTEQFLQYRASLLGDQAPNRTDPHCEFFYISGEQIRRFLKVKKYGLNLKIDHGHIKAMANDMLVSATPCFFSHIAIIQYDSHNSDVVADLVELIDGHHRIEALKQIYEAKADFNIGMWVALHKSDNPTSEQTQAIFKKYNSLKPFIVDLSVSELSGKLITELNATFDKEDFNLVKDSSHVNRPSIKKSNLNTFIQQRLENLKTSRNIAYRDFKIKPIIAKFIEVNESFRGRPLEWYSNVGENTFANKKPISQQMLNTAVKFDCYIGLVDLIKLVEWCIV